MNRCVLIVLLFMSADLMQAAESVPLMTSGTTISSIDGSEQPFAFWAPEKATAAPTPLFIFLHSWSGDYRQNNNKWLAEAVNRGWIFLQPNFRGPNRSPQAGGSAAARLDILDAIAVMKQKYQVDPQRIYLAGSSGGGHMSLLMAGYHPDQFTAVSAWVGISNLTDWYDFHTKDGEPGNYARMIAACTGGAPGESAEIDRQYWERSPIFHLRRASGLPIDLNAGIYDGYTGSVPIDHTLYAYNELAKANGQPMIPEAKINELLAAGREKIPVEKLPVADSCYQRSIHFRQQAGPVRVTIFEGGHEGLPFPACEWLAEQVKQ